MTAAAWTRTARDLINDPDQWSDYLTIQQVSDHTALAVGTLRDNMARPEIKSPEVPRGALCRPRARINKLPLWHPDQVAEYDRRVAALADRAPEKLPEVSAAEARARGLVSITELTAELGCERNTLRRIGRDQPMPRPVALAKRERSGMHGRQHELRDRVATLRWIHAYSQADGARDRIAVPPHLLAEIEQADHDPALTA